ncbi:ParB/RepB/Spo0J family partition protein [Streptomyces sp. NBC_01022]|uniref:ParB/RepB/Spo0J family partition protein n=1 Tax=Streptomyces sp. NBC_01022 TaxID=2903723 RepID=UPI002DD89349|nr:streptomycin biosynthesis regulator [Streptomyces sp. NBC_01022]WRZ87565.1 streptomycin biosynthesis regulator [Streptomyces sp. NBC_01022]
MATTTRPDPQQSCPEVRARAAVSPQAPSYEVPLGVLLAADSPRTTGENLAHARTLAASETALPPILVHRPTMRIIDGTHRVRAAILRQQAVIEAQFFDGTPEEAFVLAVEFNTTHGLALTLADRTAAAARILITHPQWSDRAVAARTGLAAKTVGALRRPLPQQAAPASPPPATAPPPAPPAVVVVDQAPAPVAAPEPAPPAPAAPAPPAPAASGTARIGRDGRVRPLSTAEGRREAARLIAADPGASLRQIARRAGVSAGTVRDVRRRAGLGEDPVPPRMREREPAVSAPDPPAASGPRVDLDSLVRNLCRDPALRQSDNGRLLLRMLDLHVAGTRDLPRILAAVPAHRAGLVAAAATECARAWQEMAARLRPPS